MVEVKLKVVPWSVPSTIELSVKPDWEQGHLKPPPTIQLCDADSKLLAEMCDQFRADVFEFAKKKDPALLGDESEDESVMCKGCGHALEVEDHDVHEAYRKGKGKDALLWRELRLARKHVGRCERCGFKLEED